MRELSDATIRQNQAAETDHSTWLSANAGSGKTRVLTDRVARLLLNQVDPQNILCLTYTKAAASEMQNRLFRRLGEWSMMPDTELSDALSELGVDLSTGELVRARRLFARAIETPGGLRIQTIHSFCASLLRRFPLEAGISPRFTEMDDRASALLRDEIVEVMASGDGREAVDGIAGFLTDIDLSRLTAAIAGNRSGLARNVPAGEIWEWFGLRAGYSDEHLVQETFTESDSEVLSALLAVLNASDSVADQRNAYKLAVLDTSALDTAALTVLARIFLYGKDAKAPFAAKIGAFPTKPSQTALGVQLEPLNDLMQRIESASEITKRLYSAQKTLTLYQFSRRFLSEFAYRKQARGWLDFDDLIQKANALLNDERVAAWVLYRLDGGLDHILVDEAQDTSPAQWQVIERLAQEFTSGIGARDGVPRSIFVVGDKKQSIYSFQGADPREFDRMQRHFSDRLQAVGVNLRPMELEYSFRSSQAILRVVDTVVGKAGMPHLKPDAKHLAFHKNMPGRVDLWAAVPEAGKPEKQNWFDPVDIVGEDHHDVILARTIAAQIRSMIGTETIPAEKGSRRHVCAGDILILVRRRSRLFEEIIRACKAADLPVAGADRLRLGGELAVKDLSALLAFIATPEDDLSLAAALRSPLFGWTEAQLYDLAQGRGDAFLWSTLRDREAEFEDTLRILRDLRDQSDFLRPYDLIERILIRHDGRRRLLARLGPDAEDGIDALLTQALAFERTEVPSLTGFLVWMETDDVEVKRQMDNAGDLIRVMTVHGAKGLESPIVILPDTNKRRKSLSDQIVALQSGELVWKPVAEMQPDCIRSALSQLVSDQEEEAMRLLYVAMTRAETWLIVAGAGDVGKPGDSWYQLMADAITEVGGQRLDAPTGAGLRYQFGDWDIGSLKVTEAPPDRTAELPDWTATRVVPPARPAALLSPSNLGGAKALYLDGAPLDTESALRIGRQIHRLFEHLPGLPSGSWEDMAVALLAAGEDSAGREEAQALLEGIRPVLQIEDLRFLFGADALAEVAITASVPELGGARISGSIDRLIVTPEKVLAVDFKTNAVVPDCAEDVPEGIQRQMGAYLAALKQVYQDREIEVAILWTQSATLMPMPNNIVMDALRRSATS